jgi:ADP-ribose diphosphatase
MSKIVCSGEYFSIRTGATGEEYVHCGDEVLIVAVDAAGDVHLGVEPSAAFGESVWLLPGGQTEPDESLAQTANRELQEEIGFHAGRLDPLGEFRPFSKYLSTRSHVYLARDLRPSRLPGDEGYMIAVKQVPLASFEALIAAGQLRDARVIAALYLARQFLATEGAASQQI